MILAANRCRDRSPNFYVADSVSEIEGILSPRIGDVAVMIAAGDLIFWRLEESDAEPDGLNVIQSNACEYLWILAGGSGGSSGVAGLFWGIGSPEGVQAAAVGSIYSDLTDTQHPALWLKTSGGATDTGWIELLAI
jgi:hypothetical protein